MYKISWVGLFEDGGDMVTKSLEAVSESEVQSFEIIAGLIQGYERTGLKFKSHLELSITEVSDEPKG